MDLDNSHITLYLTDLPTHILTNITLISNNFNLFLTCSQLYNRTLLKSFRVNYLNLMFDKEECFKDSSLSHPWLNNFYTLENFLKCKNIKICFNEFKIIRFGLKFRKVNWFPQLLDIFETYEGINKQALMNEFLVEACSGRHIELIELILRMGGDPSNNQSKLILDSVMNNDFNLTKLLLIYTSELSYIIVNNLLKGCANIENIQIIEMLLDRGADINFESGYLIRQQSYLGNSIVVQYLLKKGADPTLMNHSTLLSACQRGHSQLVALLIKYGCSPNFNNGMPIFFSVNYNRLSVIKELIRCGANPNLNNIGYESLIIACKKGNLQIVKYLVEKLKVSIEPYEGNERSPIVWAIIHQNYEVVEYLIKVGANLNNPNNCCLYYSQKSKQSKLSRLIELNGGKLITK